MGNNCALVLLLVVYIRDVRAQVEQQKCFMKIMFKKIFNLVGTIFLLLPLLS